MVGAQSRKDMEAKYLQSKGKGKKPAKYLHSKGKGQPPAVFMGEKGLVTDLHKEIPDELLQIQEIALVEGAIALNALGLNTFYTGGCYSGVAMLETLEKLGFPATSKLFVDADIFFKPQVARGVLATLKVLLAARTTEPELYLGPTSFIDPATGDLDTSGPDDWLMKEPFHNLDLDDPGVLEIVLNKCSKITAQSVHHFQEEIRHIYSVEE